MTPSLHSDEWCYTTQLKPVTMWLLKAIMLHCGKCRIQYLFLKLSSSYFRNWKSGHFFICLSQVTKLYRSAMRNLALVLYRVIKRLIQPNDQITFSYLSTMQLVWVLFAQVFRCASYKRFLPPHKYNSGVLNLTCFSAF